MNARSSVTASESFVVNGRFYTQALTGVQRYAREVVSAVGDHMAASRRSAAVVVPAGVELPPSRPGLVARSLPPAGGHLWEQLVLPARSRAPLLNLCNTAPLVRVKQVVCIHDANVFRMPESYGFAFRTSYKLLQPGLARRSARIATVSADSARQIAKYLPLRAADIAILPNGHEHALTWNPAAATVFDVEDQNRPFILLLGSRARHKNARLVLGLADALDAMGLDLLVAGGSAAIFAGDDGEAPGAKLRNVRYLGRVSDDDLALLFSRALCLAFPSFTEGFGLPILEAMALGCPVISSNSASMPEVCGDAALMAAPDDPSEWIKHFRSLAGSEDLREELRERGRRQAGKFSWSKTAKDYIELMDRLP